MRETICPPARLPACTSSPASRWRQVLSPRLHGTWAHTGAYASKDTNQAWPDFFPFFARGFDASHLYPLSDSGRGHDLESFFFFFSFYEVLVTMSTARWLKREKMSVMKAKWLQFPLNKKPGPPAPTPTPAIGWNGHTPGWHFIVWWYPSFLFLVLPCRHQPAPPYTHTQVASWEIRPKLFALQRWLVSRGGRLLSPLSGRHFPPDLPARCQALLHTRAPRRDMDRCCAGENLYLNFCIWHLSIQLLQKTNPVFASVTVPEAQRKTLNQVLGK